MAVTAAVTAAACLELPFILDNVVVVGDRFVKVEEPVVVVVVRPAAGGVTALLDIIVVKSLDRLLVVDEFDEADDDDEIDDLPMLPSFLVLFICVIESFVELIIIPLPAVVVPLLFVVVVDCAVVVVEQCIFECRE